MASLENYSSALSDQLLPGLDFKSGPGAGYVLNRTNTTLYPTGSNDYSNTGTRQIKFNITGDWCDPASVLLHYKLVNKDSTAQTATSVTRVEPLGQAHVFFSSMRLLVNGQLLEECSDWNRLYELLLRCSSPEYQRMYAAMGFGLQEVDPSYKYSDLRGARRIKPGEGKSVTMPLLCGLFQQHRFIPLSAMQLSLELTCSSPADVCKTGMSVVEDGVTVTFNEGPISIQDVTITMDQIQLDSALQEQYMTKLLTSVLPIPLKCWHSSMFSLTGEADATTIGFSRSVSRLCTVWVSFYSVSTIPGAQKAVNYFPSVQGSADSATDYTHPFAGKDTTPDSQALEYQFAIDGSRFPSVPIRTTTSAYASACKSLGLLAQTSHALGIPGAEYQTRNFVIIEDMEKVPGFQHTGRSLRGGSQLLMQIKGLAPAGLPTADKITRCYMAVQYDVICELSSGSVTVLE